MTSTAAVRLALGGLLLCRPELPARLTRTRATHGVVALTRLLGVRYLGQGALDLGVAHDRRLDAGVELLHAASMLPLAYGDRRHARLALLGAGAAVVLAVSDVRAPAGGSRPRSSAASRVRLSPRRR